MMVLFLLVRFMVVLQLLAFYVDARQYQKYGPNMGNGQRAEFAARTTNLTVNITSADPVLYASCSSPGTNCRQGVSDPMVFTFEGRPSYWTVTMVLDMSVCFLKMSERFVYTNGNLEWWDATNSFNKCFPQNPSRNYYLCDDGRFVVGVY